MSTHRRLHTGWTLSAVDGARDITAIPAAVPGCVHTDLLTAGLIDDPYRDDNETSLTWIGRTDWSYRTEFDWQPQGFDRTDLVFDGLDTVATVRLNGVPVATTANMHRSYRIDTGGLLTAGTNTLEVAFRAPYAYTAEREAEYGALPGPYDEPYQFIRKMACNFGWDWGPTLVTSGIWRPVGLHSWSGVRLAEVRPAVRADGVDVHVRVERVTDAPVEVTAEVAGAVVHAVLPAGQTEATLRLDVPDARLWWPRGYGDQPLYPLTVTAGDDAWTREIGFRTVELDTDAFRLIINGEPVFVKGFNWIPDDCFPARITTDRLRERFDQAVGTGANTLRVWGGGLYESDDFYALADAMGLLVWQDFPFACAAYPEDDTMRAEVAAEARENVVRLMSHPSLVIWCGNNENIEGHQHWDWREPLGGRDWGAGFYFDLLPRVVAELDPTRPYWPGSPYSGAPDRDVHDPSTGTIHIWTVWGQRDYTFYDSYTPRFVAEFGFQGPPAYATLRAAVSDQPLTPDSPGVMHHQKATDGNAKLLRGLGDHLPQPENFDDWHYYTQLNQARAIAYGVQRFRALMPYCMGTIVWQLNDCWPVTSWAAVDGDARRKPLWYALRRAYADRLITFHDGGFALVNDCSEPWTGELHLARLDVGGQPLAKDTATVTVAPRSVLQIQLADTIAVPADPARELLTAELDGVRAVHMFAEDPQMLYPPAAFDAKVDTDDDGVTVTVTAVTLLRELALFPDRLDPDAAVDEQLVTLLPGETATFRITTARELPAEQLLAYPVLRCVNEARP
ncbi:beta-mannosidase [Allocatelliglobosispora scoriae]|uniref:beta-mannosidase n=1 Tax=Allocatelliglobosispora scoriae TaxID=643052 RepID=A0A841BJG8_9ACTN|nr:glycoside hydrolase family 2 protein [Allocatelliglobosispora scoriae]MBB5867775.1 beta-mannosidase [Allocatelliglobosispora scoriae]